MAVNLYLEALKWRELLKKEMLISPIRALKSVFSGLLGGFITPYRVGEIPARLTLLPSSVSPTRAMGLGIFGGVIQDLVIGVIGIVPTLFFLERNEWHSLVWACIAGVLLIGVIGILNYTKQARWTAFRPQNSKNVILLSTARYVCWLLQFYLIMSFTGISIPLNDVLIALPTYYVLVTVTPNLPAADLGIRGGWAVFVLGRMGIDPALSFTVALWMWVINTILPMFIYPFIKTLTWQFDKNKP